MGDVLTPFEILRRLIAFDTVSARSNKAMIEFIADYLEEHGISCNIAPNEDGTKADMIATIGPMVEGGIVLSGHTDVVPVEGQDWQSEPFNMVERDGLLYGRGTCDMKGFIAVVMSLVPEMIKLNLKRPLHLVFSYDEEVGCLGAPALISRMIRDVPMPQAAIIGEPTSMKLVNAHKGVTIFETVVTGCPAHSSQTQSGVNAITVAAECIVFLKSKAKEFQTGGSLDARLQPPYNTVSVGMIEGGTALNIIAGECKFNWDCRSIAGQDAGQLLEKLERYCLEELLPPLKEIDPNVEIVTRKVAAIPPLTPSDDNPAEALVRQLTGQNQAGAVSFAAEAGMFQDAGVPSVICGPGSITQAHQPNEFVEITQIDACTEFVRKIAHWAADKIDR